MNASKGPAHVVVDGSNLATEGRSMPSLKQLSEAVMSFMEENPGTEITVVVDATFGHRIDKEESKEFEEGISNNELVAPPAGAVGRGDAFVLGIADKAGSTVLSNDSFQEFHGDYDWLFDEGRLIGGKPVPHVGWVWVARTPVRGPVSRKATRGSGSSGAGSGRVAAAGTTVANKKKRAWPALGVLRRTHQCLYQRVRHLQLRSRWLSQLNRNSSKRAARHVVASRSMNCFRSLSLSSITRWAPASPASSTLTHSTAHTP